MRDPRLVAAVLLIAVGTTAGRCPGDPEPPPPKACTGGDAEQCEREHDCGTRHDQKDETCQCPACPSYQTCDTDSVCRGEEPPDTDDSDNANGGGDDSDTDVGPVTKHEVQVNVTFTASSTIVAGSAHSFTPGTYDLEELTTASGCKVTILVFHGTDFGTTTIVPAGGVTVDVADQSYMVDPLEDDSWFDLFGAAGAAGDEVSVTVEGDQAPGFTAQGVRPSTVSIDALLNGTTISRSTPLIIGFTPADFGTFEASLFQSTGGGQTTITCSAPATEGEVTVGTDALAYLSETTCVPATPATCANVSYVIADRKTADIDDTWRSFIVIQGQVTGPGSTTLFGEQASVGP